MKWIKQKYIYLQAEETCLCNLVSLFFVFFSRDLHCSGDIRVQYFGRTRRFIELHVACELQTNDDLVFRKRCQSIAANEKLYCISIALAPLFWAENIAHTIPSSAAAAAAVDLYTWQWIDITHKQKPIGRHICFSFRLAFISCCHRLCVLFANQYQRAERHFTNDYNHNYNYSPVPAILLTNWIFTVQSQYTLRRV